MFSDPRLQRLEDWRNGFYWQRWTPTLPGAPAFPSGATIQREGWYAVAGPLVFVELHLGVNLTSRHADILYVSKPPVVPKFISIGADPISGETKHIAIPAYRWRFQFSTTHTVGSIAMRVYDNTSSVSIWHTDPTVGNAQLTWSGKSGAGSLIWQVHFQGFYVRE